MDYNKHGVKIKDNKEKEIRKKQNFSLYPPHKGGKKGKKDKGVRA